MYNLRDRIAACDDMLVGRDCCSLSLIGSQDDRLQTLKSPMLIASDDMEKSETTEKPTDRQLEGRQGIWYQFLLEIS